MYLTDEAIVISAKTLIKQKQTIRSLTRKNGRLSLILYPSVSRKYGTSFLTPLSHIELTYSQVGTQMPIIKEYSILHVLKNTLEDMRRRCITVFISEVIEKTISYPQPDDRLFDFLLSYINRIETEVHIAYIPIWFMIDLSEIMGFSYKHQNIIKHADLHRLPRFERQQCLRELCQYFILEIDYFTMPKSLPIIEQLFD